MNGGGGSSSDADDGSTTSVVRERRRRRQAHIPHLALPRSTGSPRPRHRLARGGIRDAGAHWGRHYFTHTIRRPRISKNCLKDYVDVDVEDTPPLRTFPPTDRFVRPTHAGIDHLTAVTAKSLLHIIDDGLVWTDDLL